MLHCTIQYYTIQYYSILYYTVLYYTLRYCPILYYTTLYNTKPYYIILYYTMLYYLELYCTLFNTSQYNSIQHNTTHFITVTKWRLQSHTISSNIYTKLQISDGILFSASGCLSDFLELIKVLQRNAKLYKWENRQNISVNALSHLLAFILYSRRTFPCKRIVENWWNLLLVHCLRKFVFWKYEF